jgi:hypothetical protein
LFNFKKLKTALSNLSLVDGFFRDDTERQICSFFQNLKQSVPIERFSKKKN